MDAFDTATETDSQGAFGGGSTAAAAGAPPPTGRSEAFGSDPDFDGTASADDMSNVFGHLADLDPVLATKVEGALQSSQTALSREDAIAVRADGLAYAEYLETEALELDLLDAVDAVEDGKGDVDPELDAVDLLQGKLQLNAELLEAENEFYALLRDGAILNMLAPLAAVQATMSGSVQGLATEYDGIVTELNQCLGVIQTTMDGLKEMALREQLKSYLGMISGSATQIVGAKTAVGMLVGKAIDHRGGQLIDLAIDGKTDWAPKTFEQSKNDAKDIALKLAVATDGVPAIAGALLSWYKAAKGGFGTASKLNELALPALDAMDRIKVLADKMLTGSYAQRITATKAEVARYQELVTPLMDAAIACAGDAIPWQTLVKELRAEAAGAKQ